MLGSPDITCEFIILSLQPAILNTTIGQSVDAIIFTTAESQLSLIATSLPTLGPLLRRIWSGKSNDAEEDFDIHCYTSSGLSTSQERFRQNSLGIESNTETRTYGDWKALGATEAKERKNMSPQVIRVQSPWSVDHEAW
jgi:hypothetical protein